MSCNETSYKITLAACPEQIFLRTNLPANTNYQWAIVTKFGNIVMREVRTDIEGTITIESDHFVSGMFNQYAGSFELMVFDVNRVPIKLTFSGKEYDNVIMDFVKVDSTDPLYKNIIE